MYLAGALADDGGDEVEIGGVEKVDDFDGTAGGEIDKGVAGDGDAVFCALGARDEGGDVKGVTAAPRRDEAGGESGKFAPIFRERAQPEMQKTVQCVVDALREDAVYDALFVLRVKMHK